MTDSAMKTKGANTRIPAAGTTRCLRKQKRPCATRITVAQQREGIGQRACGQIAPVNGDLQLYQQNKNAKNGFRASLIESEHHQAAWKTKGANTRIPAPGTKRIKGAAHSSQSSP